jgi:hypothetical protein
MPKLNSRLAYSSPPSTISAAMKTGQGKGPQSMRTLTTSNDLVRLSFLNALLRDAGIDSILLDAHASAVEGSIGAIPRRLMVQEEDETQARRILKEAGLS